VAVRKAFHPCFLSCTRLCCDSRRGIHSSLSSVPFSEDGFQKVLVLPTNTSSSWGMVLNKQKTMIIRKGGVHRFCFKFANDSDFSCH